MNNNVDVGVEVPATTINASSTPQAGQSGQTNQASPISNGSASNQSQTAGSSNPTELISTTSAKGTAKISPKTDAGLALFAVLFIIIAVVLLVMVFRGQLIDFLNKVKRKLK